MFSWSHSFRHFWIPFGYFFFMLWCWSLLVFFSLHCVFSIYFADSQFTSAWLPNVRVTNAPSYTLYLFVWFVLKLSFLVSWLVILSLSWWVPFSSPIIPFSFFLFSFFKNYLTYNRHVLEKWCFLTTYLH